MRRWTALLALLATAVAAAVSIPAGAQSAAVAVADCVLSPDREDRSASFAARMRAVPGSRRMGMRFTLLERVGSRRYQPVDAPALRSWRYSRRGVQRFVFTQRVEGLRPGGSYVMRVEFRWFGRGGRRIASAQRRSGVCTESGGEPNLRVGRVTVEPAEGNQRDYAANIHNDGSAEIRDVAVVIIVDGTTLRQRTAASIPAGGRLRVAAQGPRCQRELRVVADPHGAILESDEDDNVRAIPCPAAAR